MLNQESTKNLKPKSQNHNLNLKTRCFIFSIKIIKLTEKLPPKKCYWIIADQLIRSATSIGANIAEAKGSNSKKDFTHFYQISLKSANESKYWLNLLIALTLTDKDELKELLDENIQLANILAASILTMRNKR
ncbi:MAG: four helix bundle protein [Patescibacteria group bacterium]